MAIQKFIGKKFLVQKFLKSVIMLLTTVALFACSSLTEGKKESEQSSKKPTTKNANGEKSKKEKTLQAIKAPKSKLIKAYELITVSNVFGKTRIICNKDFAFVDNGVVQTIHRPPHDKVYFLSHEDKSCLIWNTDETYPFTRMFTNEFLNKKKLKVTGKTKVRGYKCTVLKGYKVPLVAMSRYTLTKDMPAPPSLINGYSQNFIYPEKYGYPMLVEYRERNSEKAKWQSIYDLQSMKEIEIEESKFDVPPYRVVKDMTAFAFFTPGSKHIEDLFEYHFDKKKK